MTGFIIIAQGRALWLKKNEQLLTRISDVRNLQRDITMRCVKFCRSGTRK